MRKFVKTADYQSATVGHLQATVAHVNTVQAFERVSDNSNTLLHDGADKVTIVLDKTETHSFTNKAGETKVWYGLKGSTTFGAKDFKRKLNVRYAVPGTVGVAFVPVGMKQNDGVPTTPAKKLTPAEKAAKMAERMELERAKFAEKIAKMEAKLKETQAK